MRFGRVEVYRGNSGFDNAARPRRKNLIRFLIFLFVFVACAAASLAYVFGRPPVYESVASVLITPPAAEETWTVNAYRGSSVVLVDTVTGDTHYRVISENAATTVTFELTSGGGPIESYSLGRGEKSKSTTPTFA